MPWQRHSAWPDVPCNHGFNVLRGGPCPRASRELSEESLHGCPLLEVLKLWRSYMEIRPLQRGFQRLGCWMILEDLGWCVGNWCFVVNVDSVCFYVVKSCEINNDHWWDWDTMEKSWVLCSDIVWHIPFWHDVSLKDCAHESSEILGTSLLQ